MRGHAQLFSKGKDDWMTPESVFMPLHNEFAFELDAAADANSALCPEWFGSHSPMGEEDALKVQWAGYASSIWCNPPYSAIKPFMQKAAEAAKAGATVVCLVPSRTDTKWFHEHVYGKAELRFIKGRVRFIDPVTDEPRDAAPFPSMIVIFRGK